VPTNEENRVLYEAGGAKTLGYKTNKIKMNGTSCCSKKQFVGRPKKSLRS
jgi:hypothetical protein